MGLTNNLGKLSNMITSTGSAVGIGTSSPVSLLNLSASTPTLTITDSAATGNGGNTYISSIKNGVGYNNLTFTAYSYTFLGGGSASTFLTINTAGAATFSSSVTAAGNINIENNFVLNLGSNQGGGATLKYNSNGNLDITPRSGYSTIFTAGNVGIGTSSPSNKLVVSNSGANGFEFDAVNGTLLSYNRSTSAYSGLNFNASQIVSYISGTEAMRITSGGNVGIGTSSPLSISGFATLEVKGTTAGLVGVSSGAGTAFGRMYNDGTKVNIGTSSNHALVFDTNDTERMRITSGGNVGIFNTLYGINNVRGDGGYGGIDFTNTGVGYQYSAKIYTFKTPSGAEYYGLTNDYGAGTGAQLSIVAKESSGNSGNIGFYVAGGTERMRISANGNIRIGADGLNSSLSVIGTGTIVVLGESGGTPKQLLIGIDGATGTSELQSVWQGVAYTRLNLNPIAGAVYAGGTRLDTLSDARVKDNVQPITGALDKVLSITGKKFHLKDEEEGKIRYGFIAQELEGILDEFVIQTNMTFKKDDLKVENVKSIDNWASSWSALLVEAIKEQQQQIDELKIKIK